MKIAVYTLTRDRLQYTQASFASLRENAGHPYHHFVFDNGSDDGTQNWLKNRSDIEYLFLSKENHGISVASNQMVHEILCTIDTQNGDDGRDLLVLKVDNDCLVITPNILAEFVRIYSTCKEAERWVLAPRVEGINNQPRRVRKHVLAGQEIGVTAIVGGIFHVVPAPIYRHFMADGGYDENLPLAWGSDDAFCDWLARNGYAKGYVESLAVEHMEGTDGQAQRYPEYFKRKWEEEKKS